MPPFIPRLYLLMFALIRMVVLSRWVMLTRLSLNRLVHILNATSVPPRFSTSRKVPMPVFVRMVSEVVARCRLRGAGYLLPG